jgi:hypothetical protein
LVLFDRKHSEVSNTVKIMFVSITELIWQAKTRGKYLFALQMTSNAMLLKDLISASQIAVPMAFTRCQQSLYKVLRLFFK